MKRLPNILTIGRFVIVPFFGIAMGQEDFLLAIILYVVASLTDVLDGAIARRLEVVSDFGKIMDPAADKVLQIVALIMLTIKGMIHPYLIIVVFCKELLMSIGAIILYHKKVVIAANWYGKAATVIIFSTVIEMIFISKVAPAINMSINHGIANFVSTLLLGASLMSVIFAFACYFLEYLAVMRHVKHGNGDNKVNAKKGGITE